MNNKKAYFIIEEPESNLFPNAQKLVVEFVSMIKNNENKILITTHSPYVLGTINNLLYADDIYKNNTSKEKWINEIIKKEFWLDYNKFSSYFLERGINKNCCDEEARCIKNEVIDGASREINEEFDRLLELGE